ncbi:hypothetical protein GF325_10380 [Candidatus Bathyarchaeota archaeon]|nr:hypothetical protein [Candidatus Bathyarchaeota archaeon]
MAEGGNGKIVGLFLAALVLGAAGGYGAVWFFPPSSTVSGSIIKEKKVESRTQDALFDNEMIATLVDDMELNITTKGNSYLKMRFSTPCVVHLASTFDGNSQFNLSLHLDGKLRDDMVIFSYHQSASGYIEEYGLTILLECTTETLAAGTHVVNVTWWSMVDSTGSNQLILSTMTFNSSRLLVVEEIAA